MVNLYQKALDYVVNNEDDKAIQALTEVKFFFHV